MTCGNKSLASVDHGLTAGKVPRTAGKDGWTARNNGVACLHIRRLAHHHCLLSADGFLKGSVLGTDPLIGDCVMRRGFVSNPSDRLPVSNRRRPETLYTPISKTTCLDFSRALECVRSSQKTPRCS